MRNKVSLVVLVCSLLAVCALVFGPHFLDYDAFGIDEAHWNGNPMPPCFVNRLTCGEHILGADENGRDELARLLVGGRYTLATSLLASLLGLAIAVILAAGIRYGGRALGFVVTTVADALSAFPMWPFLLSLCLLAAVWVNHPGTPTWVFISIAFACLVWPRLVGAVEKGNARFLLGETLEQWRNAILVVSTVDFFGYGVQPPFPSWGNMLSGAAADLQDAWWSFVFPGTCIFLAVLFIGVARRVIFPRTTAV